MFWYIYIKMTQHGYICSNLFSMIFDLVCPGSDGQKRTCTEMWARFQDKGLATHLFFSRSAIHYWEKIVQKMGPSLACAFGGRLRFVLLEGDLFLNYPPPKLNHSGVD